VSTATADPPSASDDSSKEGYLCFISPILVSLEFGANIQELLQEQYLEVINQGMADVRRPAMLEHVLPEGEVRQKRDEMILKVFTKVALCRHVGLHLAIVR
jgi:hypothetical protein